MKDKSIAIKCDEMTQEVMKDLQQAMESSFSRTSENLSEEIIQKLEPINSSLNKLRNGNEENVGKLDDLIEEIRNISKSIKSNINEQIKSILKEQAQTMEKAMDDFNNSTQEIKHMIEEKDNVVSNKLGEFKKNILNEIVKLNDKIDNKTIIELVNKLESNFNDRFNSMREELKSGKEEIRSLNAQSEEEIVRKLEIVVDKNASTNKEDILNEILKINHKIDDKAVIEIINKLELSFNERFNSIQEEVEWGNKSLFAKIFGRKR